MQTRNKDKPKAKSPNPDQGYRPRGRKSSKALESSSSTENPEMPPSAQPQRSRDLSTPLSPLTEDEGLPSSPPPHSSPMVVDPPMATYQNTQPVTGSSTGPGTKRKATSGSESLQGTPQPKQPAKKRNRRPKSPPKSSAYVFDSDAEPAPKKGKKA
ncbi:hypothetical protein P7C73_g6883, partial [Tremellales sp. Uapishka_1]